MMNPFMTEEDIKFAEFLKSTSIDNKDDIEDEKTV